MTSPHIQPFFEAVTGTISYVVSGGRGSACAIIDAVLDYDARSSSISTASAEQICAYVRQHELRVEWILETHAHADHLTAAAYLRQTLGGKIGISGRIVEVQRLCQALFGLTDEFHPDGRAFDHLFAPDEAFTLGALPARALAVAGHTPADVAYQIGDAVFVGDALFMPDLGSGRCDFPGGDAHQLYHSIRKLLALPGQTRLFAGHDYPPAGRPPAWESRVAEQRLNNIHVHDGVSEEEFVLRRQNRDVTLALPTLFFPALQVNIRAGELPAAEANGRSYLKIPLTLPPALAPAKT